MVDRYAALFRHLLEGPVAQRIAGNQRMGTRITSIGKRIVLKLRMSIRPSSLSGLENETAIARFKRKNIGSGCIRGIKTRKSSLIFEQITNKISFMPVVRQAVR